MSTSIDFTGFRVLTFDCYGTLIDWETGILRAMTPLLESHGVSLPEGEILERYARYESEAEHGPFRPYREILCSVVDRYAAELGITPREGDRDTLAGSLGSWPPFPDTGPALLALKKRYRLAVISNIDDELFAETARLLPVKIDHLITAQQVGSYKPSLRNFEVGLERIGEPRERVLHVAQSLYHDIAPARQMGLATIWINRRMGKGGGGATPPSQAMPDLTIPDLATLVSLVEGEEE